MKIVRGSSFWFWESEYSMVNYYEVLGITPETDEKTMKKAYRVLAKKYHPDRNVGNKAAEEKFKLIGEAYQTLSDAVKRADYNKLLAKEAAAGGKKTAGAYGTGTAGTKTGNSQQGKRRTTSNPKVDFANMAQNFENFFGFDPKTGQVTQEDKLNPDKKKRKNPLDTSDLFDKFMGFK